MNRNPWLSLLPALLLFACADDPPGNNIGLTNGTAGATTGVTGTATGSATAGTGTGTTGTTTGGGTTSTTATSSTGSTGTLSDGGQCERAYVQANRAAPDMLIVMDASGSMAGITSGIVRWNPAVQAVNTVVGQLEDSFKFGLMTYPANAAACLTGQVDVPLATGNAGAIASYLGGLFPATGNTPTSATLAVARDYLSQQAPTYAGEFPLPQYVMLVTDGEPNCVDVNDPFSALGGASDQGAIQASRDAVSALTDAGVRTYVIGYDSTSLLPAAQALLDELAVLGNTGDTQHRSVTSGDQLLAEFQRITAGAVSCSFVLAQETDFERVKVYLDGQDATYGSDWNLRDDGYTVDLLGDACEKLRGGATLEAEVVCEVVNII